MRHTKLGSRAANNEISQALPPSINSQHTLAEGLDYQRTFGHNQTVWRSGWADKGLQITVITASVHQMERPNADQPLEGAQSKRRLAIPVVLKFLTILCAWNIGETLEEAVRV